MLRYIILLFALTFVDCGDYRGDQGLPATAEQQQDILLEFGNEDSLDENIQEMTQMTQQQLEGDAVERINEDEVDDEIASAEKHESYPVWKILLVVAGCAIGMALSVGVVVLVLKSRNNNNNVNDNEINKEEDCQTIAISCLGKKVKEVKEVKEVSEDKEEKKESQRIALIDHIRHSIAENIPV